MGRYRSSSSDDDDRSKRSKRRKKRRSRSSSLSSQQSHLSDRNKKLRRKHRRSSRSRSRSTDRKSSRSSRRSRSPNSDRYSSRKPRSRSRSSERRGLRRSRSPAHRRGRSRSPSSRRPRSYSRSRTSSRDRRKRSRSYSKEHSSHNGEKSYSSRSSVDRHRGPSQLAASPKFKGHPELSLSSHIELTPYEQAEERMRLALKAAASAGEKVKGNPIVEPVDAKNFSSSVAAIESDSFVSSNFRSSRSTKVKEEPTDSGPTHDDAIFGSLAVSGFTLTPDLDIKPLQLDSDSIMHQSLYCDPHEKMEKWIARLTQLRRRKLEGDVL